MYINDKPIKDKRLKLQDVGLLVRLFVLNSPYTSIKELMELYPMNSKKSITACVHRLEKAGYLRREQTRASGRYSSEIWHITEPK